MATLTLGKSVTIDQVASKKGDAVFVERRRRVIAPGSKELREEPVAPVASHNAADEKLRAVLAAARAREEERKRRAAEEEAQRAARAAEIARENRGKIVLAVLDSAAECEFFYPKLKYFLSLDGKPFDVRMLPEPPPSSSSMQFPTTRVTSRPRARCL